LPLMNQQVMHIGLDDTDSKRIGCTTYIAALLVEEMERLNATFLNYPSLVRLNPNVPWKTRGNGALCLRIKHASEIDYKIKETAINLIEEHSDLASKGTNPGIVFFQNKKIPEEIKFFARKAIIGIVTLKEAMRLVKKYGSEALGFKSCRGIIGALAAIGETLEEDYTYELIAYRASKNFGAKRKVNKESIFEMDKLTRPYTFNNVDSEKRRVIITPRGPDPLLFGIRGETAETVKKAFRLVKPLEPVDRWLVFRSNQGTDSHLKRINKLNQLSSYRSVVANGVVSRNPRLIPLRHVVFSVKDETGEVDCAAYEPTGVLRKVTRNLIIGDKVEVYGAVRKSLASRLLTINLEKIKVLALAPKIMLKNPVCPECGKRLESMGKGQGFRCKKCRRRFADAQKVRFAAERELKRGLYVTSTRSQRHLTKPLRRYGLEKHDLKAEAMIENWHFP